MNTIEIRKVNNGYMVLPAWNGNTAHQITDGKEVNVFETFEALTEFLRKNFGVTSTV